MELPDEGKEDDMKTLERPQEQLPIAPDTGRHRRSARWIALAFVAVLALVVGGAIGWAIRGDDTPGIVLAGGGDLSARQAQMYDFLTGYEQDWKAGDVDAVLARFTPNGTFEAFGQVYRVDDGSFATYFEGGNWSSLDVLEPGLVRGNELFTFHGFRGADYSETITFTGTGDLLITSHVIHS